MTQERSPSAFTELRDLLVDLELGRPAESLRVPGLATRRALLQLDFVPREPDAKTMERHLRAVYREELADLFEMACRQLLFGDSALGGAVFDDGASGVAPVSREAWNERAGLVLGAIPPGAIEDHPVEVARALCGHRDLTLVEVAGIGQTLRPLPEFDVYMGLGALSEGRDRQAEELLLEVYFRSPFPSSRSDAACALGALEEFRGDFGRAMAWYRLDALSECPWSMSALAWLVNAIQVGDRAECELSSARLRESSIPSGVLADYFRREQAARFAGVWSPTTEATSLALSRSILDSETADHVRELFK